MLTWQSHPHMVGTYTAVGARGEYSVQNVGAEYILQGTHDGLPMIALDGGRPFPTLYAAQQYANQLDQAVPVEAQIGGE